jgi:diacylglycerol kinase
MHMPPQNEKSIVKSFRAAWRGLLLVLLDEPAFRYMLAAAALVAAAIVYFDLSRGETALLLFLVFAVLALEVINTLFERMLDIVRPEYDERVRRIKDIMAGLVLLASIGAAVLGTLILLPYVLQRFVK